MSHSLSTDYLVVGTGAVGMAFADTLVAETEADIVMVDRYPAPGGHWNVAYPFVTLHQPSAYYGVNSVELSRGTRDRVGLNRGLADLASGAEVMGYFDRVMRDVLLPTGRVRYFPMCDYRGDGRFDSRLSGQTHEVTFSKLVDCTYLNTSVPSTHTPNFEVADGVRFIPPNDLPLVADAPDGYTVVGGGKTGVDTVLWLLEGGVAPEAIRWIVSRDAWMIDRENAQNHPDFLLPALRTQVGQFEALGLAADRADLFGRLEACGYLLRLDPHVEPEMFHAATISRAELDALRTVERVVRMGRVRRIGTDEIELAEGDVPTSAREVHVDCSASALRNLAPRPVFDGDTITPQTVRAYQPAFSAALIAFIEASDRTEAEKAALTSVVPLPDTLDDYLRLTRAGMINQYLWGREADLRAWMRASRLDGFSGVEPNPKDAAEAGELMARFQSALMPAGAALNRLLAEG